MASAYVELKPNKKIETYKRSITDQAPLWACAVICYDVATPRKVWAEGSD